ncbi:MAG TPA: type II toxin-antitoxin system VapC family toxin [Gemmataceae bacterium]|nr:type II toxin-antitoxin system VapC family toxin [Gemmataceae bacterium]
MTRRYLLDAGPAQDFVQHRSPTFERVFSVLRPRVLAGICYPTLAELRGGFEASALAARNLKSLQRSFRWLKRWPFDLDAVKTYGEIYGQLHRIGRLIGHIDIQVAAVALAMGNTTVVTYDSDLSVVPGLKVENWLKAKS